jgi:hypothetical protein
MQTDLSTSPESTTAASADDTAVVATDIDPTIASQKLQTNLLAIQNWYKEWRMKANGSKSIHVTDTKRNVPSISGCTLTEDLPGIKKFSQNRNNEEPPLPKCIGYWDTSQNPIQTTNFSYIKQHRNFGTIPVEDLAHGSGRTLVRAEYGYAKEFPNTNS